MSAPDQRAAGVRESPFSFASLHAEMREMQARIATLPPRPWCFMASHRVPYGRVYRQWDTKGRLLVWVNRGEVAEIPLRPKRDPNLALDPFWIDSELLTGIPVVNA